MEATLREIVDRSVNQTMSRTLLTSFTTLAVVVLLILFGGEGVAAFAATLAIGLVLGTYSSIFVASPVLLALNKGRPASALISQATTYDDDEEVGDDEGGMISSEQIVDTEAVVTTDSDAAPAESSRTVVKVVKMARALNKINPDRTCYSLGNNEPPEYNNMCSQKKPPGVPGGFLW